MAASSSCQPPTSVCRRLPPLNRPASNSSVLKLPLEVHPSSSSLFIDPAPRQCSRSSLTSWLTFSIYSPIYVVGDFYIRLDRPDDPHAKQLRQLVDCYGLELHCTGPTHQLGGTLYAVITHECWPSSTRSSR